MNLWDVILDPRHIEPTSKDLYEGSNVLCKGSKELCEDSKPCRSTPPHVVAAYPPFTTASIPWILMKDLLP